MVTAETLKEAPNARGAGLILVVLACLNLISQSDRYLIPAVQPLIKAEFGVNDKAIGTLSSAFFLVFMLSMPLTTWIGSRLSFKIMTCGAALLWSAFTLLTAESTKYSTLLLNHALFAVGEASFAIFAPVLIAEFYAQNKRHQAMTLFALTVPLGTAMAFAMGSLADDRSWRFPLRCMAGVGAVAAVSALLLMMRLPDTAQASDRPAVQWSIRSLMSNSRYLATVIGGACFTFSMVGMAVWLPTFLAIRTGLSLKDVNSTLGFVTIVSGGFGAVLGGFVADRWLIHDRGALYLVSAASMILGALSGTVVLFGPAPVVFPAVAATQLFLFLNAAPMGAAMLNSVAAPVRASALALSMFVGHAVGDGWSPMFIGWMADRISLRVAMAFGLLPLAVGCYALLGGARAMRRMLS